MDDRRTVQKIELQDGRKLGFAESGPVQGTPIFYFHGFPSSRLDWQLFNDDQLLAELNARIIALDRPGYGLSDFQRSRKTVDWPVDVVELANALQIDRFAVLGISGGGPYAIACASEISDCLTRVGVVCGMGPSNAPGMQDGVSWTIPGTPSLWRRPMLMLTAMGLRKNPGKFVLKSQAILSKKDSQLLDQPEMAALFAEGMCEAFRNGIGGANQEAMLYTQLWGFKLQDIAAEVHLWHGEQDLNVPAAVGRYVAEALPNCQATFFENEGHFSLPCHHMREILRILTG
jgi:pimeloyl-ACP methyl ester carboxylesterase